MPKLRNDSTLSLITQVQSLRTEVTPTAALGPREMEHFHGIIQSRESASWSKNDVFLATQLARMYVQMETVVEDLGSEFVIPNPRGTMVSNPLVNTMTALAGTVQALNRTLGLSASQRGVAGEEQGKRNKAEDDLRNAVASPHSLLA